MMYKNLLVQVDDSRGCAKRIACAIDLAAAHEAHLTGLYILPEASPAAFAQGFPPELMNDLQDVSRASAGKLTLDTRRIELAALVWRAVEALRLAGRFRQVST